MRVLVAGASGFLGQRVVAALQARGVPVIAAMRRPGRVPEGVEARIFEATDVKNLEASFAGVAEELRRQYSIGYYPENPGKAGERRSVKIKVTKPNAVVRAKSGYVIRQLQSWKSNEINSKFVGKK